MFIEYNNNGEIISVYIGNIKYLKDNPPYISVPSSTSITEKSRVNTSNCRLEDVDFVVEGGYEITESTNEEAFELEIL